MSEQREGMICSKGESIQHDWRMECQEGFEIDWVTDLHRAQVTSGFVNCMESRLYQKSIREPFKGLK